MSDKGLSAHRTGETGRRRMPEEDGRRRRLRQNIVPSHVDDMQEEDLLAGHDADISEEGLTPVVTRETRRKSDEKLVDNFLLNVFGQEALERDDFFHSELVEPIAETIVILATQKARERPELNSELLTLAQKAQRELRVLDEAEDFSRLKLHDFFEKYKRDLASLLAYNNDNNMSREETTSSVVEKIEPIEAAQESPDKVAEEKVELINQKAEQLIAVVPEAKSEVTKLVDDSQNGIKEVLRSRKLSHLEYAENELDKIGKPKSKVEINAESPEAGSKIDKIKSLIKKLNDAFSAAGVEGYAARRKFLQEADDLIGTKQYQDIVLSHSKDKDKELLINEAIERAVKELEDMLRNEEIRVKNLEKLKEIKSLRDLIKQLEASFGAPDLDGYDARKKALQEAVRILGNDVYLVILNHDKDGGMSVNEAIEKAILEAEGKIRALEAGDNTGKANVNSAETAPVTPAPEAEKVDLSKLMDASAKAVEADPNVQEARRRLDGNGFETKIVEADPELDQKRSDFWAANRERGNFWSKNRHLRFTAQTKEQLANYDKIKEEYDNSLANEKQAKLLEFMANLDPSLSEQDKKAKVLAKHMELDFGEEDAVDDIATKQEVSGMGKFKAFWRKTALHRLGLGIGMFVAGWKGVDLLAKAAAVGMGPGFIAARVALSSTGAYMSSEALLDTRTKWAGQKGLIDDLKDIAFKKKKKGGPDLITQDDKTVAIKLLMSEKYPLEILEKEHARLRTLSLDKHKGIKDAGRFGAEQILMVEAIQTACFRKRAQAYVENLANAETPEQARAKSLASLLSQEKAATLEATSAQDKSRIKAIARNSVAAFIGVGTGWLIGSKLVDKLSVQPEATTPPEGTIPVVPEVPIVETPDQLIGRGDTVWGMVEDHLAKVVPDWDKLNPAQQTRYIDYFENKIVDDPSAFGLTDPDHLQPGTKIHWGDLFADKNLDEGMKFVKTLTPEQMQNIVENNKILSAAAKHGVEITHDNVNDIIRDIRANGLEQYLAEHGHGVAQAAAENAQDIAAGVDAETEAGDMADGLEADDVMDGEVEDAATESLEQTVSDEKVEGFLTGARAYTGDIYESIQSYAETAPEHAHEQMSALVNKVFESSAQVQQDFLQDLNPEDFTPDNNKAEVFLKAVQASTRLPDINSLEQLQESINVFDGLASSTALPGKEFVPRLLDLGSEEGPVYAFAKQVSGKFLGLFGEKQYLVDYGGNLVKFNEEAMSALLKKAA